MPSPLNKQLDELLAQQKEAILKEVGSKLEEKRQAEEILDKRLEAKKKVLENFELESAKTRELLEQDNKGLELAIEANARKLEEIYAELSKVEKLKTNAEEKLKTSGQKRLEINQEIKDRNTYRDEQEVQVNNAIAEWNIQLVEFHAEIDASVGEKSKVLGDIIRAEQSKTEIQDSLTIEQDKLKEIQNLYEQKSTELRNDLGNQRIAIEQAKNNLSELMTAKEEYIKNLEVREKAVRLKEVSLGEKEKDLLNREKRLKQSYSLSGLPLE